jgi:SAM-dependent methyltransferase
MWPYLKMFLGNFINKNEIPYCMTTPPEIRSIYEIPGSDGRTMLDAWEQRVPFEGQIAPYIFDPDFKDELFRLVVGLIDGEDVLSVGCGNSFFERDLTRKGYDVIGADVSELAIRLAREKGVDARVIDAKRELPFPPNSFDFIFFKGCIEHLLDEENSIDYLFQNCRKVLRAGGGVCVGYDALRGEGLFMQHPVHSELYLVSSEFVENGFGDNGFVDVQSRVLVYNNKFKESAKRVREKTHTWGYVR